MVHQKKGKKTAGHKPLFLLHKIKSRVSKDEKKKITKWKIRASKFFLVKIQ